jgi:hypothetical protein
MVFNSRCVEWKCLRIVRRETTILTRYGVSHARFQGSQLPVRLETANKCRGGQPESDALEDPCTAIVERRVNTGFQAGRSRT